MKITKIEQVTEKQYEILILLYRFRFLNRLHIQKFLNHKSDTRILSWLKDLTERKIINRLYVKNREKINESALYYLANKSIHILKNDKNCNAELLKRIYRLRKSSNNFRTHCLSVADLYFYFLKVTEINNSKLHFYTSTDLENFSFMSIPPPDAYIAVEKKDETKRYFLILIDGAMKWFLVIRNVNKLIEYYKANYWQSHSMNPFPKILLICPHRKLKNHLTYFVQGKIEEQDLDVSFFIGMASDIEKRGIQADTWEAV